LLKSQISNTKFQVNSKFQVPNPKQGQNPMFVIFNFGYCDLFVICYLEFSIAPPQSSIFNPPINNRQSSIVNIQLPIVNQQL